MREDLIAEAEELVKIARLVEGKKPKGELREAGFSNYMRAMNKSLKKVSSALDEVRGLFNERHYEAYNGFSGQSYGQLSRTEDEVKKLGKTVNSDMNSWSGDGRD